MASRGPKKTKNGRPGRTSRADAQDKMEILSVRARENLKKKTRGRRENKEDGQKAMAPIDRRGVKTGHRSKYGFYCVKLIISCWLGSAFFSKSSMLLSLKGALGATQGAQGGPSPISRGVLGTPKSPDRSPKGVSEGPLCRLGMKNTEMETNSAFSK